MTPEEACEKILEMFQWPWDDCRRRILDLLNQVATTAKHDTLIEVAEKWERKGMPCREDIRYTYFEFARKLRILAEEKP